MKKYFASLLIILVVMLTGCVDKTPLSDENKVYAGKWVANDGTWIQVYNDGGGSFEQSNSNVKGGSANIADNKLTIGLMGINATFSIDKPPYEEDGKWKMELDGNTYIKQ